MGEHYIFRIHGILCIIDSWSVRYTQHSISSNRPEAQFNSVCAQIQTPMYRVTRPDSFWIPFTLFGIAIWLL